jgi:hypothetical protein
MKIASLLGRCASAALRRTNASVAKAPDVRAGGAVIGVNYISHSQGSVIFADHADPR